MLLTEEMKNLVPSAIVQYLDRYIVGQEKAKRAVAVALRNRLRRRKLPEDLAQEIAPKNILMVGPTGVGKTEIARRLADLVNAPFVKVEATKFTEVGYVGRDVESMVRDLVENSMQMVKKRMIAGVQSVAFEHAQERLVDYLLPVRKSSSAAGIPTFLNYLKKEQPEDVPPEESPAVRQSTRERMLNMLKGGKLDEREVEIDVQESTSPVTSFGNGEMGGIGINISEMLGGIMPKKSKKRRMKVKDALRVLQAEEAEKLIDIEAATQEALDKAQQEGIIFIDEIDKIVSRGRGGGPDVSREGVQRDLLPIVEGCSVTTKYGQVKTDHIFFIAAGAFHDAKPSDLVPELQGRLPIRVELTALGKEELRRILVEPQHSLIHQAVALIETEGVELRFTGEAVEEIAAMAERMNLEMENIGARRLHTILEQLLEEISFSAPERAGEAIEIDTSFVVEKLEPLVGNKDLRRYLL
ncbi:ATP-dependent protease ATPase subunit HslU [Pyramidobacter sp. SM-530-WT-4B]|uniref:ATP-dependent protease ATPase subunit HslU n=1 Tax=Pyramidobacter porci TaxID=2605789 RepID=A0A6L5Y8N5_9BACT|nr:ATP-dependent protease ATPase subunit HslU [Pyramidobacter porci]MDY2648091.1 ATP-dependent protease ATPase subunit HslU [Pyramidobacter porci]MST54586.1 ATP-dependent protease ATPase subunit HslU [Pyramidobacter porci]